MTDQFQSLTVRSRAVGPVYQDVDSYYYNATEGTVPSHRWSGIPFKGDWFQQCSQGFQFTWSRGNPWPPSKGSKGAVGGPFRTIKCWWSTKPGGNPAEYSQLAPMLVAYDWPATYRHLRVLPYGSSDWFKTSPNTLWNELTPGSQASLESIGTRAVERCKPTRTANQLLTALVELKRDGIPEISGSQFVDLWRDFRKSRKIGLPRSAKQMLEEFHSFIKTGGSEHLNLVFGWFPLLSDTQKLLETYSKIPKIWAQYERDAGRLVRRSYSFPTEQSTTTQKFSPYGNPVMINTYVGPQEGALGTFNKKVDRWFNGAFRYYLPDRKDGSPMAELFRFAEYANKCYGLAPTPDNIWNVIPWTWALDWFSNIGSVVGNLSDTLVNGLVMPYGYMCEQITYCLDASLGLTYSTNPFGASASTSSRVCHNVTIKQRVEASPYGFGIGWDNFSPSQLAILASIGINRF